MAWPEVMHEVAEKPALKMHPVSDFPSRTGASRSELEFAKGHMSCASALERLVSARGSP
jgi:hypothetical protein